MAGQASEMDVPVPTDGTIVPASRGIFRGRADDVLPRPLGEVGFTKHVRRLRKPWWACPAYVKSKSLDGSTAEVRALWRRVSAIVPGLAGVLQVEGLITVERLFVGCSHRPGGGGIFDRTASNGREGFGVPDLHRKAAKTMSLLRRSAISGGAGRDACLKRLRRVPCQRAGRGARVERAGTWRVLQDAGYYGRAIEVIGYCWRWELRRRDAATGSAKWRRRQSCALPPRPRRTAGRR